MNLLTLARGPILQWALVIFVVGTVWRLAGILLLRRKPDYTEPRSTHTWRGAANLIVKRTVPKREFAAQTAFGNTIGYVFHIGLAVVVFGFVPHILFIKSLTGLSWPGLPSGIGLRGRRAHRRRTGGGVGAPHQQSGHAPDIQCR
jgi:hypothetical protein